MIFVTCLDSWSYLKVSCNSLSIDRVYTLLKKWIKCFIVRTKIPRYGRSFNDMLIVQVHGIHDEVWEGIPQSGAAWLRTRPLDETWLRLLAVPFGGGVLVGILNTMRQTLDDTVGSDNNSKPKSTRLADARGMLRAFLKAVGAAVTLGTGCSLGPEGPSVEIGASIANGVGTVLSNSRERKLSFVAAGSAAGISSGIVKVHSFSITEVLDCIWNHLDLARFAHCSG